MRKKSFVLLALTLILGMLVMSSCNWNNWRDYKDAKKLVKLIRNEDLDAIKDIINKNPECINTYPSNKSKGWQSAMNLRVVYPLTEACIADNVEIVELLIKNGADVNCNDGLTPLSVTCEGKRQNWYEIFVLLIENGADINYGTEYTAGSPAILQDIVQVGPGASADGYVPESKEEVLKAFFYAVENCNRDEIEWMRVLQHSVSNDRIEIVKFLLDNEYCQVNDNSVGMTALMFASRDSTTEMVQLLLDYGADKSIVCDDGKTALDYAIKRGNEEIIALLSD